MDNSQSHTARKRKKRSWRVRKATRGSSQKPRLCVVKTNDHLYVQLIDDEQTTTLASTSTRAKEFRSSEYNRKNCTSAKHLGLKIAEEAKGKGVKRIVFDRGRFKYHGVIAAVADGAREGGLEF